MQSSGRSYLVCFLAAAVAILALCWPAIYNGQPFYYPDTFAYLNGPQKAVAKLLGRKSADTKVEDASGAQAKSGETPGAAGASGEAADGDGEKLAGRSIYYGILLYVGELAGGNWVSTLIQAFFIAFSVFLTARIFMPESFLPAMLTVIALAIVTPVGFFVSYQMPDMFAALTILAFTNILLFWNRLSIWELAYWILLLIFSVTTHSSHLLLCLLLAGTGFLFAIFRPGENKARWKALGIIASVVVIGVIAEAAFQFAVTKVYGKPPLRPPFIMARVVADGPGYRYIEATCPQNGFAVCAFKKNLPVENADVFLWDRDPNKGVFNIAQDETRRALSDEQIDFALKAILYDPLGQIQATAANIFRQIVSFGLQEFNYPPEMRKTLQETLPADYAQTMRETRAYKDLMPTAQATWVAYSAILLSLFYMIAAHTRMGLVDDRHPAPLGSFAAFIVIGVLLNAAITGALSEVHDRYEARVIWLLPLVALMIFFYIRLLPLRRN